MSEDLMEKRFRAEVLDELRNISNSYRDLSVKMEGLSTKLENSNAETQRILTILERGDRPLIYVVKTLTDQIKAIEKENKALRYEVKKNSEALQTNAIKDAGQGTKNDLVWRVVVGMVSLVLSAVVTALIMSVV